MNILNDMTGRLNNISSKSTQENILEEKPLAQATAIENPSSRLIS